MVDGLTITGSPLPTAEPSEVRLPVMLIMSALAVWLKREMAIAPRAAIGIRTLLFMRPPHFYLRRRSERIVSTVGFFEGKLRMPYRYNMRAILRYRNG